MGQLRDSLGALSTLLKAVDASGTALAERLEKQGENARELRERVYGGHEVIVQYLDAKLKKKNQKLSEKSKDKLQAHWDPEIAKYVKGVEDACKDAIRMIESWNLVKGGVDGELKRFNEAAGSVSAQLEKKRGKLFQSKTYKSKLAGYDATLQQIKVAADKRFSELAAVSARCQRTV